jgi:hypothetical protein
MRSLKVKIEPKKPSRSTFRWWSSIAGTVAKRYDPPILPRLKIVPHCSRRTYQGHRSQPAARGLGSGGVGAIFKFDEEFQFDKLFKFDKVFKFDEVF